MIHKRFQHDTKDGGIEIQFDLEYDGEKVSVVNIHFHSNFKSGLPHNVYLEYNPEIGKELLSTKYPVRDKNDKDLIRIEWLTSAIAMDILNEIQKIKEEETPKFIK